MLSHRFLPFQRTLSRFENSCVDFLFDLDRYFSTLEIYRKGQFEYFLELYLFFFFLERIIVDSRRKRRKFRRMGEILNSWKFSLISAIILNEEDYYYSTESVIDRNFKVGGRIAKEIKVRIGDFISQDD